MRLKYIRLAGFKSFVDNTKVAFPEQMTCIVGPNGCGKSNVIDAVRWVLGESSAKNLRGDAMTDVIFNGSQVRKPVGQASVELVFDNSDGRLQGEYVSYQEVSVKRVVTRDGQSLYFLNNAKCRRRDITDLFLGTGLGPRSYAIIEQGMISRLIESRPQELRIFIEEAAGISKYKERRKETESRMSRTRENLERLTDVREELGQQLAKLQRQAAAAKRYQQLKAEERAYKSQLQALKWLHYQEQCDRVERELTAEQTELEKWLAEQRGSERGQTELRQQELDFQEQVDQAQESFYQASSQVTAVEQQIRYQRQMIQQRQQQRDQWQQQWILAKQEIDEETIQLEEARAQLVEVEEQLAVAEEELAMALEAHEEAESRYQDWQENNAQQQREFARLKERHSVLEAELHASTQLIAQVDERHATVRQELANLEQEKPQLPDALLTVARERELAAANAAKEVEAFTSALKQAKLDEEAARQHVDSTQRSLSQLAGQQASYEQLLAAQEAELEPESRAWLASQTCVGTCRELLEVPLEWVAAVELWAGQWLSAPVLEKPPEQWPEFLQQSVLVLPEKHNAIPNQALAAKLNGPMRNSSLFAGIAWAENEGEARALLNSPGWHAVALPVGKILGPDWILAAGEMQDGLLAWQQALNDVLQTIELVQAQGEEAQTQLTQVTERRQSLEEQLETARSDWQQAQQVAFQAQERFSYAEQSVQRHEADVAKREQELETLSARVSSLKAEHEVKLEQKADIELQIETHAPEVAKTETLGDAIKLEVSEYSRARAQQQQQVHTQQLQKQQYQSRCETIQAQLERLQRTMSEAEERLQLQTEDESSEEEISVLEEQLAENLMMREQAETALVQIKEQLSAVQEELSIINKGQSAVHEQIAKQREKVESRKLELAAARERGHALLESFGEERISLKEVLENMPEEANEREWQQALDERSRKIQQLGAINLAAIEEVEAQSERKAYLDDQYEDLSASLATLEDAIKKIDRETRSRFKKTYDQVNSDLQALFPKVFGGGSAYLDLTDDDLLETGVTIMARPPGKKNSTIHLLSGGEKALTALALVFAIFRLNPAPFCLLDEVDAPLDDVNVGRFCRLVKEMSESVQFIYISHNKIAMEMATHLAGVTMQEPGVSRLVAVDVDEAIALAEAS